MGSFRLRLTNKQDFGAPYRLHSCRLGDELPIDDDDVDKIRRSSDCVPEYLRADDATSAFSISSYHRLNDSSPRCEKSIITVLYNGLNCPN